MPIIIAPTIPPIIPPTMAPVFDLEEDVFVLVFLVSSVGMEFALNGVELEVETTKILPTVEPYTILFWKLVCDYCALELEETAMVPEISVYLTV